ncbi:hypothetical protein ColTof4_11610 [Colletotrichum tofieldiae]|nr:hypothetical protein ColTof3_03318 [Colletotrichum tofieldiae]GKT79187.1 hypothetical protein ColTof4_11610 [Colletotrichum tofieldiae]
MDRPRPRTSSCLDYVATSARHHTIFHALHQRVCAKASFAGRLVAYAATNSEAWASLGSPGRPPFAPLNAWELAVSLGGRVSVASS